MQLNPKRSADPLPQNLGKPVELRGQGCCHWGTSLHATMLLLPAVLWDERQAGLKWGLGTKCSATMSHVYSCHRHLCHMKTHTSYGPCSILQSCHLGSSPPFIRINRQEEVTDAGKNTTVQRNGTTLTGRVSLYEGAQAEKKHAGKFSTFLENKFSVFWVSVLQQLEGQSRCGSGILWDQRRLLELVLFLTRHLAWMANDLLGEKIKLLK